MRDHPHPWTAHAATHRVPPAPDAAHLAAASSGPGSSAIVWVGLGVGVAVAAVLAAAAGYVWWWHSPRGHALRVDTLFASQAQG